MAKNQCENEQRGYACNECGQCTIGKNKSLLKMIKNHKRRVQQAQPQK